MFIKQTEDNKNTYTNSNQIKFESQWVMDSSGAGCSDRFLPIIFW